jgi:hypothetical protein
MDVSQGYSLRLVETIRPIGRATGENNTASIDEQAG